ncbi:phospholipase C [Rhodoblastus acidophilus]|uniref:alkaline phosphatase family protein n=1 Tax=Rhodoblastus acidophilus TaxID=1074 RepID=UPI002224BB6C|nr:alkaline phosphatase family protein [Rhodoblastus acidophilus]MCW2286400.1 phospholipase C [Rhodoblastus acidophilus]MCW2335249.1 phospholipase C [Rhodoblastus acidophilus]
MKRNARARLIIALLGLLMAQTVEATARRLDHVFVLVLENRGFDDAVLNGPTPFLRELAERAGLATQYFGVAHPSLPNYLALVGGDTFGIRDDRPSCFASDLTPGAACNRIDGDSLAEQLTAAGLTYAVYAESLPAPGAMVAAAPSRAEPLYAQKHNPFPFFTPFAQNAEARARMKPLDAFAQDLDQDAPNFALIVPNQCHDGHGLGTCGDRDQLARDYDATVRDVFARIRASKAWSARAVFVVTFDEGARPIYPNPPSEIARRVAGADNHIATLVATPCGQPVRETARLDHYALLATIEDGFGLVRLRKAAGAPAMETLFYPACGGARP